MYPMLFQNCSPGLDLMIMHCGIFILFNNILLYIFLFNNNFYLFQSHYRLNVKDETVTES